MNDKSTKRKKKKDKFFFDKLSINYVPIISKQIYLAFIEFSLKKNEPGW